MLGENIKIGNRRVWMHKAINHPDFASESVLTRDPWSFVELWLKRQNKSEALSFWSQALRFHEAAKYMDVEASPLSLYYSFERNQSSSGGSRRHTCRESWCNRR
ncbi:hypothetical protein HSBAA_PA_2670 (plasmid) [Vreelandella sulfidaeris]|uniref:Uncharacterized protein n=1 Tax=Vreelandella sulfidaeris TaxID=115553 RepID=A0A455US85_9GAMM|nr:hypothetical protein HSBAA_PA_2670 [Halomonas sulfidaeris]